MPALRHPPATAGPDTPLPVSAAPAAVSLPPFLSLAATAGRAARPSQLLDGVLCRRRAPPGMSALLFPSCCVKQPSAPNPSVSYLYSFFFWQKLSGRHVDTHGSARIPILGGIVMFVDFSVYHQKGTVGRWSAWCRESSRPRYCATMQVGDDGLCNVLHAFELLKHRSPFLIS